MKFRGTALRRTVIFHPFLTIPLLLAVLTAIPPGVAAETQSVAEVIQTARLDPDRHVVRMEFDAASGRVYFSPKRLEIDRGDTVIWVQDDPVNDHDVVAYPSGIPRGTKPFRSPLLKGVGQTWSRTFDEPGTYRYHCHPHEQMGMRGVVVVERETPPGSFRRARDGEHAHGDGGGHAHTGHDHGTGHGQHGR